MSFIFKRHINLKLVHEYFLVWLSLGTHERLSFYEKYVIMYLYDLFDRDGYKKLSEWFNFKRHNIQNIEEVT